MALTFPNYFPTDFLAPVVKAEAEAQIVFLETINDLDRPLSRQKVQVVATAYFTAVALEFARQACEAARAGRSGVDQVADDVDDFCRRLRVYAEFELLRPINFEYVIHDAETEFRRSSGWLEHLKERATVAQARSSGEGASSSLSQQSRKVGGPKLAAWLTEEMEKRDHMTDNRLHELSGLDRKTIRAIRAGGRVSRVRLAKLVTGLSQVGRTVSLSDIPND